MAAWTDLQRENKIRTRYTVYCTYICTVQKKRVENSIDPCVIKGIDGMKEKMKLFFSGIQSTEELVLLCS